PLPSWAFLDSAMRRWHYGRLRYVAPRLLELLRRKRPVLALANMQMHSVVPFIVGGSRLGLTMVGNIASWDHAVGKGIVAPRLQRYLVQNVVIRDDPGRYREVDDSRIVVTGLPQTVVVPRQPPRPA